jgi:hypothetical protein
MDPSDSFFPESYLESCQWFRDQLPLVRQYWPLSEAGSHALTEFPDLSIDWIEAPCRSADGQMIILSTAVHGIEGLAGTAVLHRFLRSYLHQLDPAKTGLLLLHAINPWGMEHRRHTNANNVDLNRNFRFAGDGQPMFENRAYDHLCTLLHPPRKLAHLRLETLCFLVQLMGKILRHGVVHIRQATLLGQLKDPKGLYFAGFQPEEENLIVWELITSKIRDHRQVVHLDIHTGYGPPHQMTLVNSIHEQRPPNEWIERFGYPWIIQADPQAFYTMQGDMLDALYLWTQQHTPHHRYFGTAFEFGTLGDGLLVQIRGLRALVLENQIAQHGAGSTLIRQRVDGEFGELFYPSSQAWRLSAMHAVDQAFDGIFREFGLFKAQ